MFKNKYINVNKITKESVDLNEKISKLERDNKRLNNNWLITEKCNNEQAEMIKNLQLDIQILKDIDVKKTREIYQLKAMNEGLKDRNNWLENENQHLSSIVLKWRLSNL